MESLKVVSADSHMTEPGSLWVERLDKKYRDDAPRVIKNPKPNGPAYVFVGPGIHPLAVAAAFAAGKGGSDLREHMKHGYETARPSGWEFFGAENYMCASDFPHSDSTFPNSQKVIRENFASVPAAITNRIVFENANRLYGLGL